jgi:hypothetical protein
MYSNALDSNTGAAQFLQTTLDPANYNTVPPNLSNQPNFTKNVSISGNWLVGTATNYVKDTSGLVIWNVQRGIADIKRYGFVNAAFPNPSFDVTQAVGASTYNAPTSFPAEGATGNTVYTIGVDTIVPIEDAIDIAPNLATDFSITRAYAGRLMLVSDTVPIGNTALAGRFAAGVISDLRDMEAKEEQFNESDLVQQSMTGKDGLKQVRAMDGIVTLLGADLPSYFSPPDRTVVTDDGSTGMEYITGIQTTSRAVSIPPGGNAVCTQPVFVTPRNLTQFNFVQDSVTYTSNIVRCDNLPPDGRLEVKISVRRAVKAQQAVDDLMEIECNMYHVYISAEQDGTPHIWWGNKSSNSVTAQSLNGGGNNEISSFSCTIDVEPELGPSRYMYLGTCVIFVAENLLGQGQTALTPAYAPIVDFTLYARSLYGSGRLGPSRVIRWDNFSTGQEIKLDGLILAQCVPEGQIAPYVATSAQLANVALHMNIYPWLNALYNGDSPIRRNWRGPEYTEFLRTYVDALGQQGLEALQAKDVGAAQAAGLFGTLAGNALRGAMSGAMHGALSSVFGTPIGNASGGANAVMGQAAGQFGEAGGQFGLAGGQFGEAGGQFGMAGGQFGLVSRGLAAGEFGARKRAKLF